MKKKILFFAGMFAFGVAVLAQVPSDTNYMAYYPFSGSFRDTSGHGNHAEGTNVTLAADRWGIANSAVEFPASSAVVEGKTFETGGAFSVAAWIKCQNPKAFYARVFDFGNTASDENILLATYQQSGRLTGESYTGNVGGGADKVLITDNALDANKWTHVSYVNDGAGNGALYINGVLVKQGAQNIIAKKTRLHHYFGKSLWVQDAAYEGKMDDIYVANRAFSAHEIDSLFKIVPSDLKITVADTSLALGETVLLRTTISNAYSLADFISFKSLDPSIATVSDEGVISAVKIGKVKIVVSTANGAVSDTAEIKVYNGKINAYYPFNNNFLDESGHDNDAQATDVTLTTDRFGLANSAVEFPAAKAVVQGKSFELDGTLSVSAWIKCKNTHSIYARVFDFGNGAGHENVLLALFENTAKLTGETYLGTLGGANDHKIITKDTLVPNQWTHVVYVNDGAGKGYVYINGKLAAENGQYPIEKLTRQYHYFGQSLFGQDGAFEGKMDDIYVSKKVFNAKIIDSLFRIVPADLELKAVDLSIPLSGSAKIVAQWNNKYDLRDFITYQSLDPTIATVNDTGLVVALKKGIARIVVSTANFGASDTALVRVPDQDIYAYYPFNNGSGRDESANGNDMQVINAVPVKGRFGEKDSALAFGTSDKVVKASTTSINDNKISYTAWVRVNSFPTDGIHISSIVGSYAPSWVGLRLGDVHYAAANRAQFVLSGQNTADWVRVNGTTDLHTNQYYFLVATYDGATAKLYVNGKLDASAPFDKTFEIRAPMEIGASNNDRPLDGTIDEVRIYNRAISEKEIDSLFKIMPQPAITKFDIVEDTVKIQKDSSRQITLDVQPRYDITQFLMASSTDHAIATLKRDGYISALSVGTAKIAITSANGVLTDTVVVNVIDTIVPITKLTISPEKLTLIDTASSQLTVTIEPQNASVKRLIYTSSNENVATVVDGKIIAKGAGTALIIAQSAVYSEMKDTCELTVRGRLVAYYPFNGNANNEAVGASGYAGVVDKAELVAGITDKPASAYHFNCKDQAINIDGALPRNNFTYSAWIMPDSAARKRNQFIISAWNGDRSDVIRISVNDSSFYAGFEDNDYQSIHSNRFVKNQKWYNVALVKQADSMSFYINGLKLQVMHGLPLSVSKTNTKFCIGSNPEYTFNEFFAGTIDELRIYSDALSDKQVDSLFMASADSIGMPRKMIVYKDSSVQIPLFTKPNMDWSQNVSFVSGNESVATVTNGGVVHGIAEGTMKVFGFFNMHKDSCEITVKQFVAVTSVKINKDTAKLNSGDNEQIVLSVMPDNASDASVVYKSSDELVASVSATGLITANAAGNCYIVATSVTNPTVTDTIVVTVKVENPITSLVLYQQIMYVEVGKSVQLAATVQPSTASNKTVHYQSTNSTIATVSETGLITAVAPGSVAIVAQSASNPEIKDTCLLTVIAVSSIDDDASSTLVVAPNPASEIVSILTDETVLTVKIFPGSMVTDPLLTFKNSATFNVSNLPTGLYIIQIVTDQTVRSQKLLIQR